MSALCEACQIRLATHYFDNDLTSERYALCPECAERTKSLLEAGRVIKVGNKAGDKGTNIYPIPGSVS